MVLSVIEKLSGDYYKATPSHNCLQSHIVSTREECKIASAELSLSFQDLTKSQKEDLTKHPAGCFWYKDFGEKSSFNPILDASKIKFLPKSAASMGGVCKHEGIINHIHDQEFHLHCDNRWLIYIFHFSYWSNMKYFRW